MDNILCIDIGGTRIKAGILNEKITVDRLKVTNVKTMTTLGWMNNSLPEIISKDHPASLINEYKSLRNHTSISIGVPLLVKDKGKKIEGHYIDLYGVPPNLLDSFKAKDNCDILISNDSIAWITGALRYFQLSSIEIDFPCLTIILGTGVGLAYADSYNNVKGLEISAYNHCLKHFSNKLNDDIHEGAKIHEFLGERFFRHVKDAHKSWTYTKIQNEYTGRLIALFKDMEESMLYNYKAVKSIIIAGGNSNYLSLPILQKSLNKSIYILSKKFLKLNPDLIPLLGLLSLASKTELK